MERAFGYLPEERVVLIVGNYGSGKTEVSVNLAIQLSQHHHVAIADLDIVNPYFRCREARGEMEKQGIEVINPTGDYHAADLPIILPEIRGRLRSGSGFLIFDVGGDDVGARILSSLTDLFSGQPYVMLQVVNAKRPFTDSVEGCLKIKSEIEAAARLSVTGLVSNTHLMEETDSAVIAEGLELTDEVGRTASLPVAFVTADRALQDELRGRREQPIGEGEGDRLNGRPILWLERRMLPPWKLRSMTDRAERVLRRKPGSD